MVGKGAQATGMTTALGRLSGKADSRTWESFTRSGLKPESAHQESPRLDAEGAEAKRGRIREQTAAGKNKLSPATSDEDHFSESTGYSAPFQAKMPPGWRNTLV
ncbi:MAG: hypothetical protein ACRCZU_01015, partial [Selenomonadaceae bacterium]